MPVNKHNRINYQQRFDNYLDHYRRRYKFRNVAVTVCACLFAAVVVTLLTAVLGDTLGYSSWLYYPARILLLIAIVSIIFALLHKPSKHMKSADGAREFESTVPAFAGRAETYLDMKRRNSKSPFIGLLAKDAAKKAATAPVRKLLPTAEILGPVVAGTGLLVLCGWLLTAMPGEWRAGMQQLWFGWFKSDILPQRSIVVEPGDTKLRLGDSLSVIASLDGFDSDFTQLHIRKNNADGDVTDWETVEMNRQSEGNFAFTMYGVSDPLEYYVSSAYTKSAVASVEVVIPPKIENIELTYRFPEWTGLANQVISDGTDIAAVANTEVDLVITTDKALTNGELLLDDVASKLTTDKALEYRATLIVNNDNRTYQLADLLGDDRIMLSEPYTITVTEDISPTISFALPSGDRNATAIEEVTVIAKAADDFEVEEVLLHYSLNGGEWMTQPLSSDNDFHHVFMLEEFKTEFNEPLHPGDLLTYYAEASDREQSTSTDIQFIDIRPFERRYTQSQQSGQGGGGDQQEPPPGEISQRQKEILVATWNLIKEQEAIAKLQNSSGSAGRGATSSGARPSRAGASLRLRRTTPQQSILNDNAVLLSDLQTKLAEQAETLAQRAEARQLLNNDPKIAEFIEYMQKAAEAMRPSADQLSSQSLQEAVRHQQRALQFLRRGELLFNDITINQNQSNGQGSSAGQDMAEIYELEMDLAKNQYETPDSVQQQGGGGNQPEDDALNKLKELARRQKQLAEAAAQKDQLSMAEQWEQEKLKRELEQLKRELEQLSRNESGSDSNQNQSSQSEQGEQGEQSQSQQSQSAQNESQQNQSGQQSGQQSSSAQQQAMQNLEQAIRDLQNSNTDDPGANTQQSLESASQRLQESLEQMQAQRQQRLQNQLESAAQSVRDLSQQQEDTAQQLREAMQRSIEARNKNEFSTGLTPEQQQRLAEQKRAMQRQLESVKQDLADAASRFADDAPQTSEKLQQAIDQLDANKAAEMMGISGDMIDEGLAPQASLRERRVTEALRNLQQDINEAGELAVAEAGGPRNEEITAEDASRSLQALRQSLSESLRNAERANNRQADNNAQASSNQSARELQQLEGSQQSGQTSDQASSEGSGESQSASTNQQPGATGAEQASSQGQRQGTSGDAQINGGQPQLIIEAITELERITGGNVDGLSEAAIDEMSELARNMRLTTDSPENDRRIDAEVRLLLRQLEQLELQIYKETQGISGIRSAKSSKAPKGFGKRSADYFRRLSNEATGS